MGPPHFFGVFLLASMPLWGDLSILSLQEAEHLAIEHNQRLLIAEQSTLQAEERRLQAISRWLPQVHYRAEFRDIEKKELFFDIFSTDLPFSHRGYSSILELKQPIFSTDLLYGLASKSFEKKAVQYEQGATENELLFAVRRHYYSVVALQISLQIERDNIDYYGFALQQEQRKLEAGNSTTLEVNQSKVAVANSISLYYSILKELQNARNSLILTLGIDPLLEPKLHLQEEVLPLQKIPEIRNKLEALEEKYRYSSLEIPSSLDYLYHVERIERARKWIVFSDREVDSYLDLALSLRPDLRATKLQIEVADAMVKEKQGHYFPEIAGYMRYSYNDTYLGTDPFFQEPYYVSGGIVLKWNLFDSLLREHEIREARSKRASSKLRHLQELQRIEVEIHNGIYQLEEGLLSYLSSTQGVFFARQAREQAAEKLFAGKIAPLEYRDAVNQLSQARNQQNQASLSLLLSHFYLRYAMGIDAAKTEIYTSYQK